MINLKYLYLIPCIVSLNACSTDSLYSPYTPYQYENMQYSYDYYRPGLNQGDYGSEYQPKGDIRVPDSYHLGAYRSPASHDARDKSWVKGQNPDGYTIDLGDSEKASFIARKLYQMPKNNRMAEIKYHKNGEPHYKGVYGTFNTKEDAQKAFDELPDNLKQGSGVMNWSSVQPVVEE